METLEKTSQFNSKQLQAIKFLGAGKIDTTGKKWTVEEFCTKVLQIHFTTFYDWQNLPGFKEAVFNEAVGRTTQFVPAMIQAQVHKAIKKQDTQAFMAVMRQTGLLKTDKIDHTTNGKDMPTPIVDVNMLQGE